MIFYQEQDNSEEDTEIKPTNHLISVSTRIIHYLSMQDTTKMMEPVTNQNYETKKPFFGDAHEGRNR
ncbi:hypothetical protein DK846_16695 [Methanospirillum lacunae]|uniref:Uncharacterized protein n=1 Tax=Methanospirillum lacunae TaxID=668570 RepID=A0A2V2MNJ8_9EURY|nr:hypothetical protein DK846_16695 [Methanospirillum lacunae]